MKVLLYWKKLELSTKNGFKRLFYIQKFTHGECIEEQKFQA